MDVLWFRLSRRPDDRPTTMGRIDAGRIFVMLTAATTGSAASSSRKGSIDEVRARGLERSGPRSPRLRRSCADRVGELATGTR